VLIEWVCIFGIIIAFLSTLSVPGLLYVFNSLIGYE